MATRSTIAVVNPDKTITQIYCHWDGYPSHNGRILKEEYNNLEKAQELVSLGDLSVLAERINPTDPNHSFDSAQEGVCVYYGRDRGEEGSEPRTFRNMDMFLLTGDIQEYNYVFVANEWHLIGGSNELYSYDPKNK